MDSRNLDHEHEVKAKRSSPIVTMGLAVLALVLLAIVLVVLTMLVGR